MTIPDDLRKLRIIHRDLPLHLLPTPDDLRRVDAMSPCECPRRYCWHWRSLSLEWDISVAEGCDANRTGHNIHGRVIPPFHTTRCKRLDPASPHDHYEPREPAMIEDAIPDGRWDCPA